MRRLTTAESTAVSVMRKTVDRITLLVVLVIVGMVVLSIGTAYYVKEQPSPVLSLVLLFIYLGILFKTILWTTSPMLDYLTAMDPDPEQAGDPEDSSENTR